MMKKTLLAALIASTALPAMASSYYVVVPVPNHSASVGNILVTLSAYTVPAGVVGRVYPGFDFNSALQVLGDPSYNPSDVRWSVAGGALPAGMSLSASGKLSGTPTAAGTSSFQVMAAYKTKAGEHSYQLVVSAVTVSLAQTTFPMLMAGTAVSYDLKPMLTVSGDPTYAGGGAGISWAVSSGALPAGLSLTNGVISGTPTAVGTASFEVTASDGPYAGSANYSMSVNANLVNQGGYRAWSDGTYASSCQGYLTPNAPYVYSGATGDGVYRINLSGTPTDVYCNQTANGGGWTLLMKQAQGDGTTLQGDTTYWTNGTTLNDTASGRNMADGNFVSAAFAKISATQYMLQAANESTVQTYSRAASTPLAAFSNANTARYSDANGVPMKYPNWFVRTTTYPDGETLTQARFGFNFGEAYGSPAAIYCGARWGWSANQDVDPQNTVGGSNDSCGGLGAYGLQYGSTYMNQNKNAWQPATLYLWAK